MASEIKMFRVTSHHFRFGSDQPGERWFGSYDAALADVKKRLGDDHFHPDARGMEPDRSEVQIQHEGVEWKRVWSRKYSEMPQSTGKQTEFGHVLVEELRRPPPPFVNPFANKQS